MSTAIPSLQPGSPAPWFVVRSPCNSRFVFDSLAGRYVVLCFFGSASNPSSRTVLDNFLQHRKVFDDENVSFLGVSVDREDERTGRIQEMLPGIHIFWDFDCQISRVYGAIAEPSMASLPIFVASTMDNAVLKSTAHNNSVKFRPFTLLLDERLRVVAKLPFGDKPEEHVSRLLEILVTLPPINPEAPASVPAPILIVPRVFDEVLCRDLISYYEKHGGHDSGFMRDINGKTVSVTDHRFKRRQDCEILDDQLIKQCMTCISERLLPEIHKAFQFPVTRIERYLVACYEAEKDGHFHPHRDNTTKGTAHRRFAVSLVLNANEFEGGKLRFPEFGRQFYSPPTGAAAVFSCSLLHEATSVTKGKRYVFLPFLYDDAAAHIRTQNLGFIQQPVPNDRLPQQRNARDESERN